MKDTETRRQYKNDGGAADRADISRSGANPDDSSRSDAHAARGGRDGKRTVSRGAMIAVVSVLGALTLLLGALLVLALRRDEPQQTEVPGTTEDTAARERESALESERDALRAELDGIQLTKDEQLLLERIKEKDVRIEELQSTVDLLSQSFTPELRRQAELFSELGSLMEERPYLISADDGSRFRPRIGICYLDLETGYTVSCGGDTVFDSASVIKAPFILSVLLDAEGGGDRYDLAGKTLEYNRDEYYREGTGRIVDSPDGTVYTYEELVRYVLSYSDNVAFNTLMRAYGYGSLHRMIDKQGWESMKSSASRMSARDGCRVMEQIYKYTEGGHKYSALMKDALIDSDQPKLIARVAGDRKAAHKYGWDYGAYHDIGIVYDEHPYAVAIFSEYDSATAAQVEYLDSLLECVDRIHTEYRASLEG